MSTVHTVQKGECLSQIAHRHGFGSYRDLYDHPDNASLRKRRPNPNILHPGDEVVIPDKTAKHLACASGQSHRFIIRSPSRRLRLLLKDTEQEPLGGLAYVFRMEGTVTRGKTTPEGIINVPLPISGSAATLELPELGREIPLAIGHLDPLERERGSEPIAAGVQQRLSNLGYLPRELSHELDEATRLALQRFQRETMGREEPDGALDASTRDALVNAHGC